MLADMAKRKAVHPVIRRLRKLRGTESQADFAKRLGISIHTLRNWEQGRTWPDFATARFIELFLKEKNV